MRMFQIIFSYVCLFFLTTVLKMIVEHSTCHPGISFPNISSLFFHRAKSFLLHFSLLVFLKFISFLIKTGYVHFFISLNQNTGPFFSYMQNLDLSKLWYILLISSKFSVTFSVFMIQNIQCTCFFLKSFLKIFNIMFCLSPYQRLWNS